MSYTSKINVESYKQTFPQRLRKTMEKRNCTQKELGEKIGVTYQAIGAYMRGETMPTLGIAQSIADYFDVSLDYLSGRSDVSSRNEELQATNRKIGLSEEAIAKLMIAQDCGENIIASFVSHIIVSENIDGLVSAICSRNEFERDRKIAVIDVGNREIQMDVCSIYKTHAEDEFWKMIGDFCFVDKGGVKWQE